MNRERTILLIEDDTHIASFISTELQYEGYLVKSAQNGVRGLEIALDCAPDLIILDRMLPDLDGLSVCRKLRQKNNQTPIIMLTALRETGDKVEGLKAGANDYLVKPFDLEELLARIQVQLRPLQQEPLKQYTFADIRMDLSCHEVYRQGQLLALTPKEYELLKYFLQFPRITLSKSRLINAVWGWDYVGEDNIVEVYIGYLRRKMEILDTPRLIHTVRGVGYILKD